MLQIKRSIIKLSLQYICGLLFAWGLCFLMQMAGVVVSQWYCRAFLPLPPSPHAYDDFIGGVGFLVGLFGGIPFGAVLGVFLMDILFFKSVTHYTLRVISGFVTGILGVAFVYWILPFWGIDTEWWFEPNPAIPYSEIYLSLTCGGNESFLLISSLFALIGYISIGLFSHKHKQL